MAFLPGSSYRVKVKPPDISFEAANAAAQRSGAHEGTTLHELLLNAANAARVKAARPALMLVEVIEVDGVPALKLHLFKHDTLTGEFQGFGWH